MSFSIEECEDLRKVLKSRNDKWSKKEKKEVYERDGDVGRAQSAVTRGGETWRGCEVTLQRR